MFQCICCVISANKVKSAYLLQPEGEMKSIYESYPLDLKSVNADSFTINFQFPEEFVPGTRECSLFGYSKYHKMLHYFNQEPGTV